MDGWLRRQTMAAGLATRAQAMLLVAAGHLSTPMAAQVGVAARLHAFVALRTEHAPPFNWSAKAVAKVMAHCERPLRVAA